MAKKLERGSMHWERDPPCLALQWVDNKAVSIVTTLDSANDKVSAIRKSKTGNVWKDITVHQPKAIGRYNKYLNGVDHSDQLIGTNNIMRKCSRWWKTLFFHDFDIVNGFLLFREHQANYPDDEAVQRPKDYCFQQYIPDFRDEMEIIRYRYICGVSQSMLTPLQSRPPHNII